MGTILHKRACFFILLLLILTGSTFGQATSFQSLLGLNNVDEAAGVFQKPDSNYIISGYISNNLNIPNLATATIKKNGVFINSAIIQTSFPANYYEAKKIIKTQDNNYVVLGNYATGLTTGHDIALLKVNSLNAKVWLKKLVGPNEEYGMDIVEDRTDGGLVIAGTDSVALSGKREAIVIKTDQNGVFIWGSKLPFTEDAVITSLIQITSSDDFVVTGFFARKLVPAGISPTIFVATIGNVGGSLKSLDYYSRGNLLSVNLASKIVYTPNAPDNGFLVVGVQIELPAFNQDILVLKFKDDAKLTWANAYISAGLKDEMALSAVSINNDADFVISGYSSDATGNGGKDGFLMKINAAGSAINWQYLYGGANDEQFNDLIQTYDKGFMAVGKSNSAAMGALATDFYMVKTDILGTTSCNIKAANFALSDEFLKLNKTTYAGAKVAYPLATNVIALASNNVVLADSVICAPLKVEAGLDSMICAGKTIKITGDSVTGGKKPYTYLWTNPDGFMPVAESTKLYPTTSAISTTTKFFFKVTDGDLVSVTDSFKVAVLPFSNFTGLPDTTCSSSSMAKLTVAAGVTIAGPGISYNGLFWYYDPQAAGPGTHTIRSFGCDTTIKTTLVKPAPCIDDIVKDTTSGSVVDPQGLFTDCQGIIYLTNKFDIVTIDTFGIVKNIIGSRTAGGYLDGARNIARLAFPFGVVKLTNGIIYFSDNNNFSIRMMKLDSSVITIAGSPPPGAPVSAYVDGIGPAARFVSPYGLTYDEIHNCLYISDDDPLGTGKGRIRMIDLTNNKVTTLAGGGITNITTAPVKGTTAKLYRPRHITTDGTYIYIVDQVGDPGTAKNIVRYTLSDSMIVRYVGVAGGGMPDGPKIPRLLSHFTQPVGICNTCSGDLFITDEGLSVLRIVHNDTVTYYPDNALFFKPQGISAFIKGFIDVANKGNNNVLRLTIKDWQLGPWIGLDTADFTYCLGEPSDTLRPVYSCGGSYAGPGISLAGGEYIFTPPAALGNYTISYTYKVGYCNETVYKQIRVVANPILTMPDSAAICAGDNALLDAGPGYVKYNWSTGQTTQTITVSATGSYKVTVTNNYGCIGKDTTFILARPKPVVEAGANRILCESFSTIIGGTPTATGAAPFKYLWSPTNSINDTSIANPTVNPLSTVKYLVVVSDKFGCRAKDSIIITSAPLPIPDVGGSPFYTCVDKPVKIGAPAVAGFTYSWTPSALLDNPASANPNATIPTPVATFITLTVTNISSGCSAKDSTLIFVYTNPNIDAGPNDSICDGNSTTLKGVVLLASGTPVISWTPATGLSSTIILNPVASPSATQNYKLVVTDDKGCQTSDSMWLYVSSLVVDAGDSTYVCTGSSKTIGGTPTVAGGLGTISYLWSPNLSLSDPLIANPTANPVILSKYKVSVTDEVGCKNQDSIIVDVYAKPVVKAGPPDTVCVGSMTTIGGTPTASGGHKPYTYSWSPGVNMNDPTLSNPKVRVFALTKYLVDVTDSAGCSDTASVMIDIFPLPVAEAGPDDTVCPGLSKPIGGTPTGSGTIGPYTYVWSDSSSLNDNKISNPTASPALNTLYRVIVSDARNCRSADSMTLSVLPVAGINISDTSICKNDSVQLIAQGGLNYLWNPVKWLNNPIIYNPVARPDSTITYRVIISSKYCGPDTAFVNITIRPAPDITAWPDTMIFRGDEIQVHAAGGVTYLWSPAEYIIGSDTLQEPTVRPLDSTMFIVMGKSIFGCPGYDSILIRINPRIYVFIPDAFTPNGDGKNDILKVETVGIEKIHFWIYNRWNQLVFETTDKDNGWDGNFKGVLQHNQTLGYVLEVIDFEGNKTIKKGTITIIQ